MMKSGGIFSVQVCEKIINSQENGKRGLLVHPKEHFSCKYFKMMVVLAKYF